MAGFTAKPRDRLPTLFEVLNRRTQSPVDLWSFYVFMREQYRGVDYLDFWLDVIQHLSLCRHYVRGLRQSILANSEIDGSSRASSVLLDTLITEGGLDDTDSHRLSAFLRGEDPANNGTLYRLSALLDAMNSKEQGIADMHAPVSRTDNFISRVNASMASAAAGSSSNYPPVGTRTASGNVITRSGPQNDDGNYNDEDDEFDYNEEKYRQPIVPGPSSGFRAAPDRDDSPLDNHSSFYSITNSFSPGLNVAPSRNSTSNSGSTEQQKQQQGNNPFRQSRISTSSGSGGKYNALSNSPNSFNGQSQQQQQHRLQQQPSNTPLQLQREGFSANVTDPATNSMISPTPGARISTGPMSGVSAAETIERLFPRRGGDITDGTNYVTRQDIRQSSHRILVTYFIPGAEREIVMPHRILKSVKHSIEVEGRDDPEVFDEAREYAFQAMEREAFPSFLAARALGNLTPTGSLIRLIVGLVALFAAFWVAFILILLDWSPKVTRLWLILPFGFGAYGIFSSLYNLDPIMALSGFSEASARSVVRIKEPYVRQLLIKRSLYVLFVLVLVAAIFVIIFALVPGHRL